MAHKTTDQNFAKDVLESDKPVLVDFWAEWCGPCRQLSPILDQISEELKGQIEIYKINIDENPETPTVRGVRGIPTLMLFKGGKHIATKVGSLPKSALVEWINKEIA